MPKGDLVGEFEHLVLLAVVRLGDEAYGMTVRREIEERTGRDVTIGAVYRTLERLARKGLVESRREARHTPVRGGRARRFFRLTREGHTALSESRRMLDRMWEGVRLRPEDVS